RVRDAPDGRAPAGPAGRADRRRQPGDGGDHRAPHPRPARARADVPAGGARPAARDAAVRHGRGAGPRRPGDGRRARGGAARPARARRLPGRRMSGITLSGVVAGYGQGDVLRGVDLEVEPGAITCLIGPNGAGKSTVLRVLSGLLRPRAGTVTCGGQAIRGWSPPAVPDPRRVPAPPAPSPF